MLSRVPGPQVNIAHIGRINEGEGGLIHLAFFFYGLCAGIHRQKPKALGLKFGCGSTRHLLHQGSPASGYRPLGGGAVTAQAQAGTRSFDHRVGVGERSVGEVIE